MAVTTNTPNREEQSYLGAGALATARAASSHMRRFVVAVDGSEVADVGFRVAAALALSGGALTSVEVSAY